MTATASTVASQDALLVEAQNALRMAIAAGADDAVARVDEGRGTNYRFRDGQLETVKDSATERTLPSCSVSTSWGR